MYSSVLSVLFLGMLPVAGARVGGELGLRGLAIAPPAPSIAISQHLSASGVLVVDLGSGQPVYGYAEDVQRPMGSLTKLMTAVVIAENHAMDEWVEIPQSTAEVHGSRAYLPAGQRFTVGDLLAALLIESANDAAQALAIYHSGSPQAFVEEMNRRALALGLRETHFANPSGLDDDEQRSTPQDLAWLTMFVTQVPEIRDRMAMRSDRIRSREGTVIDLWHTHALLHTEKAVLAGKTGTTGEAGQCLISLVEEGGREYVVVLLHSQQRYADLRTIMRSLSPPAVSARLGM